MHAARQRASRGEVMKITVQRRLVLFAGLLLLASLVFATSVQTAQAMLVSSGGGGSGTGTITTPPQSQGLTAAQRHAHASRLQPPASGPAAQTGSSTSSNTAWIAAGSTAAAIIVVFGVWALVRRRQPAGHPSAAYCAQHPEDPLCTTA